MAVMSFDGNAQATPLDDLFLWASQQRVGNTIKVDFLMTTDEMNVDQTISYVTYTEGTLVYTPGKVAKYVLIPPSFGSDVYYIGSQYFSNRRVQVSFLKDCPFDYTKTDSLSLSISKAFGDAQYSISVKDLKTGLVSTFKPNYEPMTGVLYNRVFQSCKKIYYHRLFKPLFLSTS
jgi:hypothetical protein